MHETRARDLRCHMQQNFLRWQPRGWDWWLETHVHGNGIMKLSFEMILPCNFVIWNTKMNLIFGENCMRKINSMVLRDFCAFFCEHGCSSGNFPLCENPCSRNMYFKWFVFHFEKLQNYVIFRWLMLFLVFLWFW